MKKTKALINYLVAKGFKKEAENLKELSTEPDWLKEWRDCMRHYGFQNFGRDDKWHKGRSYLQEPLDKASADRDIILVTEVHSPSEEGRRVADASLDRFIKEFYGDGITIAPREGWRSKMKS